MTRCRLAREACEHLDWRDARGQLREMACRKRLGQLHRDGRIALPARRRAPPEARPAPALALAQIRASLSELGTIEVMCVRGDDREHARIWRALMHHHPRGAGPLCGAQLRYLVRCERGWLAALAFSASAYRLRARDRFLGWSEAERAANLHRVVCNSRFLILPQVQVAHLASHVLARITRRLGADWQRHYAYAPWALESFVEPPHTGTCYRAANWVELGYTQGRGREDRAHRHPTARKRVFVHLLQPQRFAKRQAPAPMRWAEREFAAGALEPRLKRRAVALAQDFFARPMANIPQACQSWAGAKAAYRFFANPNTNMSILLGGHYQASLQRCSEQALVLAVCDSSALNYTAHPLTQGLGPIGSRCGAPIGLWLHDTVAFTPAGLPLGVLDAQCWARDRQRYGQKHQRKTRSIEDKESRKWLHSWRATVAAQARCPNTQFVMVGDREADVYELLAEAQGERAQVLIRAEHNRCVDAAEGTLWAHLQAQPVAGEIEVAVGRREEQPARSAKLAVRYTRVRLRAPQRRAHLGAVEVWAVWAQEPHPPSGVEAMRWMLLTTTPTEDFEQACQRLHCYTKRWGIEIYHRVLKSGCKIEDRQLGGADRLESCLAVDMIVAWRVMHLVHLNREVPDLPASVYFDVHQWQALMVFTQRNPTAPEQPPTLGEAVRLVGRLGGHLARKRDGEPGAEALWQGLQRLDDITETYTIFANERAPPP